MPPPADAPHQVFLSYSSKDRDWAEAACRALEGRGVRCWIAPRDIVPGTEWGAAIIDGIDRCRVMVLIFSAHANGSAQVRREVERALSKGLAILPLRVEEVRPEGAMEYALSNTHWLDAFTPPAEDRLRLLADSAAALLGHPAAPDRPTPTATTPRPAGGAGRRAPWVAGAVGLAAAVAVGVFLWGRGPATTGGEGGADKPAGPAADESAKTTPAGPGDAADLTDETAKFQGTWYAVSNQHPTAGVVPNSKAEWRERWWEIKGQALVGRNQQPKGPTPTARGRVTFRAGGGKKLLDFEGFDDQGRPLVWAGLYDLRGDTLHVCFRDGAGGDVTRPTAFPLPEERGVWYIQFVAAKWSPTAKGALDKPDKADKGASLPKKEKSAPAKK